MTDCRCGGGGRAHLIFSHLLVNIVADVLEGMYRIECSPIYLSSIAYNSAARCPMRCNIAFSGKVHALYGSRRVM